MTVKGTGTSASAPYYIGHVQHDRAMSRRETYEYLSQQTGFKPAQIRAAFLGLAKALAANAARFQIRETGKENKRMDKPILFYDVRVQTSRVTGRTYMAVPARSADGERWFTGTGRTATVKED